MHRFLKLPAALALLLVPGGCATLNPAGPPVACWRFAAYGDQSVSPQAARLVERIRTWHEPEKGRPLELIVHAGDAAYLLDPQETARRWWNGTVAPLRSLPLGNDGRNYLLALGNHEQESPALKAWYVEHVVRPLLDQKSWAVRRLDSERLIYSYSYRNAHFIALDLDGGADVKGKRDARLKPGEVRWIAEDIARARTPAGGCRDDRGDPIPADWTFLVMHPSFYSLNGALGDSYQSQGDDVDNAALLEPVLAGGVDVVIQGHVHQYFRTFPVKPGDHRDPEPKRGRDPAGEHFTGEDVDGAPVYLTVGTAGHSLYTNKAESWNSPDLRSRTSRGRLNAYAAASRNAGGEVRNVGTHADRGTLREVPLVTAAARFTVEGRRLLMEYVSVDGLVLDRFTITRVR